MRHKVLFLRVLLALVILGFWQLASGRLADPIFLSSPTLVAVRLVELFGSGEIFPHLQATLTAVVQGYVAGAIIGVGLGFATGRSAVLSQTIEPFLMAFYSIPKMALAPLFVVWLGIGLASKVAMVVSLVFFIIFFSTYAGLRDVDVNLINHVRVMGGSRRDLMRHVLFPSALTWIFASLRTCVGFAVIGAILGEYLGADRGIGWIVQYGESLFNSNMVLSGLVVLMVFVAILDGSLGWLERRFSHWKQKAL